MIGWTLCSGIGAPEVAAPWVDWRLASEIEPFPRAVLQERFGYEIPDDHNQGDPLLWSDMTEVTPDLARRHGVPLPDLLVAGTPCQSFSVAGLRKGLSDDRGNLTLKFVEICHEIVAARHDGKLCVVWENVPGVLSDKGNAFGAFLGGMVGALDALPSPADGRWPGEGMVQGPRARAAWSVLDAQWFGVAQRRRRVFVVIDFGNCVDPAQILLESDSVRGNPPSREKAGEGVAGTLGGSSQSGGFRTTDLDNSGAFIPEPNCWPSQIAPTLNAAYGDKMGRQDAETETLIPVNGGDIDVAHSLRGEGFDASEDGTGRGTPLGPVAFDCKGTEVQSDSSGVSPPLRSMGHSSSHQNAGGHAAVAFDTTQVTSPGNYSNPKPGDPCHPVAAGADAPAIATDWAVRRLTPTECARLQGFPDDHTAIQYRGKLAADGPQYKAYGNSMAVPKVRWILGRVLASWEVCL